MARGSEVQLATYLPRDLADKFIVIAQENERSVSYMLRQLIVTYLNRQIKSEGVMEGK